MSVLYAVIMAGGRGTRFWPVSRRNYPKQLLKLSQPQSMLQQTIERLRPLIPHERIILVTTKEQEEQVKRQLPYIPQENILVETVGRNTAAAIAMAAFYIKQKDPKAVMTVLPADHLIKKEKKFSHMLEQSAQLAEQEDCLITLGIEPTCPHTGYGYIIARERIGSLGNFTYYKVDNFTEKPDLEKAKSLLAGGNAYWNSGMFIWRVEVILEALAKHLPDFYKKMVCLEENWNADHVADIYAQLPSVSIDYGVMEKADNVLVFPADLGWNDLGSWDSLGEIFSQDEEGNISPGRLLAIEGRGLINYVPDKLVATIGVEDLIIVDTDDVLLICAKDRVQKVKQVVELLESKGLKEYL